MLWVPLWQVVYHRYVSYGERNINVFADRKNDQWLPHQVNSTKRVMYVLGMTDELPPEDYRRVLHWTFPQLPPLTLPPSFPSRPTGACPRHVSVSATCWSDLKSELGE